MWQRINLGASCLKLRSKLASPYGRHYNKERNFERFEIVQSDAVQDLETRYVPRCCSCFPASDQGAPPQPLDTFPREEFEPLMIITALTTKTIHRGGNGRLLRSESNPNS
ncbi:hypothetical protein F2Q68_00004122 [Brassica cretica]|uniref:Uncharacterized protein n=1 Tax=Brassica cretica TaxID=69181 RepID=A0A8S9JCS7_BRACR|nr:hypothetical protein F2Q68_00004122 [Brassica cretica]